MKESALTQKAVAAMESAVRKVVEDHKRRKRPLAVWQDGKVVMQSPEQALAVRESHEKYGRTTGSGSERCVPRKNRGCPR